VRSVRAVSASWLMIASAFAVAASPTSSALAELAALDLAAVYSSRVKAVAVAVAVAVSVAVSFEAVMEEAQRESARSSARQSLPMAKWRAVRI